MPSGFDLVAYYIEKIGCRCKLAFVKMYAHIFAVLALVITTSFAPVVHAMPYSSTNTAQVVKAEAVKGHDCHGHGAVKGASQKTAQNDKDHGNCCEKGMCKCIGGNCHGMSKIFGNGSNSLSAVSSSGLVFAFDNQFVDSAQPNRLKRPPRA